LELIVAAFRVEDTTAWDAGMRARTRSARDVDGWHGVVVAEPIEDPSCRLVIGQWSQARAYDRWAATPEFRQSVESMAHAQSGAPIVQWHRVLYGYGPSGAELT
jgi:heme-degrading monooxygenase HmoA